MEFTPNSCNFKCPRTPIYSLGVRMGVWQNKPGSRPDGGPLLSGRDDSIIQTDARPLQVISITGFTRSDQGAGAYGRLNFNTQFPYLMRVRPDHKGETSGRLKSNRQLPYTMHQRPDHSCQMSGRFILNCDSCLTKIRVRTVYHIIRTVD
jgi:hypothetical protein